MSPKKIFTIGAPELRLKSNPIKRFDARLDLIFRDMAQTMYEAQGVGLAAPQIGILRRLIVLDVGEGLIEMVNPEIVSSEGSCGMPEGCLSIPGRRGFVTRPEKVTVTAQDRTGKPFTVEADGLLARAVQHEIDHLDGVLYVDKMDYEIVEEDEEEEKKDPPARRRKAV
ncbi:MAG TPA: peptide deformylase [Candidatus Limnocylindria bacterium]|nr:peptide deformylase [Candidatus Limnocylindria bacterium]